MAVETRPNGVWVDNKHLSEWLRSQSMTRGEFANLLGVSLMTVYRWERGDTKPHRVFVEKMEGLEKTV